MVLWIALGIACVFGLLHPFAKRLHATGLWAGKALVPTEASSAYPTGIQDALTDGWPSTLTFVGSLLPFIVLVVGFFHAWCGGVIAFITFVFVASIASRTSIAANTLDRYLAILMDHAYRRGADYAAKGDEQRAEVAEELGQQLQELLTIYLGSCVPAPTVKEARGAPHGEPEYFLKMYSVI